MCDIIIVLLALLFALALALLLALRVYFRRRGITPRMMLGGSNDDVLELMSTKRYGALCKLFKTNTLDYQTFKRINNNYRNEVDIFIDYLKLQDIDHHSAGDVFKEPHGDYYIEDDVVGLNNYLSCGKRPSLEKVLSVPSSVANYKLVAYITKTYEVVFVDESSTQPTINDNYNATKKSYPRYLHAMYKRDDSMPNKMVNT